MIGLLCSQELTVSLDPVRAEDRVLSVAFNLLAAITLPFQYARLEIKECWFEHSALNELEAQGYTSEIDDMYRSLREYP